uniref:Uncharacterized protein n=1 Tax=Siphoviridae sp. ctHip2 TaxID=2827830 RepID=A0A8S5RWC5_9CAUD|nr:MAG TPA: hypothetical protein [Siphoviridae sp. ctHip2]
MNGISYINIKIYIFVIYIIPQLSYKVNHFEKLF